MGGASLNPEFDEDALRGYRGERVKKEWGRGGPCPLRTQPREDTSVPGANCLGLLFAQSFLRLKESRFRAHLPPPFKPVRLR